jgi:hypothetical protein
MTDVERIIEDLKRQIDFYKDMAERNLYLAELLARVAAKALDIKEGREGGEE